MKTVYLMFGLPGSGKSTRANELAYGFREEDIMPTNFSTDDYWIRPDGYYDWNVARIKEAHQWNYARFSSFVNRRHDNLHVVFVDNTNLRFADCRRYIDTAKDAGYNVVLVEPETPWRYDPQVCAEKNTHRVPLATIENMLVTLVENKPKILEYIQGNKE